MNLAIKQLLDDGEITQDEHDILFEDKSNWYRVENKERLVWDTPEANIHTFFQVLKKIIKLQTKENEYDLSFIKFTPFSISAIFDNNETDKYISFESAIFYGNANFRRYTFLNYIDFENTRFNYISDFEYAKFNSDVDFNNALFENDANFTNAHFNNNVYFNDAIFEKNVNFNNAKFECEIDLDNASLNYQNNTNDRETDFENTTFIGKASFQETVFCNNITFAKSYFYKETNFNKSVFKSDVILEKTSFFSQFNFSEVDFRENAYLNAENMSFNKIDIKGTYLTDPLLLGLTGYENEQRIPLNKNHFANKESARLIKAHFEKQNNITEANKYFVIEQEKYIEELKNNENRTDDNRVRKLIPLYFNKIVSHFGTDWIRAILILLLWGIIADNIFLLTKGNNLVFDWKYFGFIVFLALSYLATYTHNAKGKISKELFFGLLLFIYIIFVFNDNLNHIVKLLNPINAFKDNDNIFKDYEAFGTMVRIISATIIYQIIVAFRQNTRRG